MYAMHFLPVWTIKTIDVMDGSREITWRSDVTSRKPCNITSCRVLCKTMRHVVILMALAIRRCLFVDYIIIEGRGIKVHVNCSRLGIQDYLPKDCIRAESRHILTLFLSFTTIVVCSRICIYTLWKTIMQTTRT